MDGTIHSTIDNKLILRKADGSEELLYKVLRARRIERGLTVAQLEYNSDVSRNTIMFFERGMTKTLRQLPDVLEALGFDLVMRPKKVGQL